MKQPTPMVQVLAMEGRLDVYHGNSRRVVLRDGFRPFDSSQQIDEAVSRHVPDCFFTVILRCKDGKPFLGWYVRPTFGRSPTWSCFYARRCDGD